jgi:hypothetical protein
MTTQNWIDNWQALGRTPVSVEAQLESFRGLINEEQADGLKSFAQDIFSKKVPSTVVCC